MERLYGTGRGKSKRINSIAMNEIIFLLDKDNACQTRYLNGILLILDENLSEYSIIVTADFHNLPTTKYRKIVLFVGEDGECYDPHPYSSYPDVIAVFRFYGVEKRCDYKYTFPIPIGYNCRSNGKEMIRMYPEKKLSERKFDVFYSGQVLECRKKLVDRLTSLSSSFNIYSQSNPAFRRGMDIDDYYRFMGDSKICVSPDGASVETFRFVEACGSGCIVITTPKPDLWYYRDAPVFFINDWSELTGELLHHILSMDFDFLQETIGEYYTMCLSEEAVAHYIVKIMLWMKS